LVSYIHALKVHSCHRINSLHDLKSEIRVIIFDKYGLTVYNKSCNFINDVDIDVKLTHLKKGVYFMKIVFEDGTSKTKTIIKQ